MPIQHHRAVTLDFPQHGGDRNLIFVYSDTVIPPTFGTLVPTIPTEVYKQALARYTFPLLLKMSLSPDLCLLAYSKVVGKKCARDATCPLRGKECVITGKRVPWCFEPRGSTTSSDLEVASQIVRWWLDGFWVLRLETPYFESGVET